MLETPYTARVRNIELLQREAANTTTIKIYRDGSQVVPASATYSLIKPDQTKISDAVAAAVDGSGTISYIHSAGQLPSTIPLGEGYIQEFVCVISGYTYTFRRMAAVCRRRLYPTVSDADLTACYADLNSLRPSSLTSWQNYIDDAWLEILRRIRSTGAGYEYLVMSPESFYDVLRHLSLYKIWRDFHSSLGQSNGRYLDLANEHFKLYQSSFDDLNFIYDLDHEGAPPDPDHRTKAQPTIYLNKLGPYRWRRRR